jgi:DNA-binding NtrC family response regulator
MPNDPATERLRPEKPPRDFYRFLVVDDEPVARSLLRSILQTHGYTSVSEAPDGVSALAALRGAEFHVVLLDKNMPTLDGMEVLKQGRKLRPYAEFIMITAYGSMESAIQAMDMGAYSYVTKPFAEIEVILRRIEGAVERVALRNENDLLLDRLRMVIGDLERAEAELRNRTTAQAAPDQACLERIREAVARLRNLTAGLEKLKEKSQGSLAELLERIRNETDKVASLLSPPPGEAGRIPA